MRLIQALFLSLFVLLGSTGSWAQQSKKTRVACIGDSVTEGMGLKDAKTESYPSVLQGLLGDDYEVRNFGHSGATLLKNGHNPYVKTQQYADAMAFPADIAVIHLGLNDTDPRNFPFYRDRFRQDYVWLIDQVRSLNPDVEIYICSMTPIFTGHQRYTSSTQVWHSLLQKEIEQVAQARNVHFIDLNRAFAHRPDLITDRPTLHPNKAGAELLAKTVYRHLTGDFGGFRISSIWGSGMVLQQSSAIQMEGIANAGTPITVEWNGQKLSTVSGEDGRWSVTILTPKGSYKSYEMTIKHGKETTRFTDILVGEVWLALGQSNMEWHLGNINGGKELAKSADAQRPLRLFHLWELARTDNVVWSDEVLQRANELDFYHGKWGKDAEEEALSFSGIGYAFGRQLQEQIDVPVGVVQLAVGGSPLLSWVSRERLIEDPFFHGSFVNWRSTDYMMRWARERATTNLGEKSKDSFQRHSYDPSFNYEAGLVQLGEIPFAGALWYQGESDAENAELYARLFPLLVEDLRRYHGTSLPIYTVQLSSIERTPWPWFRWHQAMLASDPIIPGVHLAVSHDYGDPNDVHPKEKLPVANRLVALALQYNYHRNIVADSPIPLGINRIGADKWRIDFVPSKGRLATTDGSSSVKGLEVITTSGERIEVSAIISKDQRSLEVTIPANSGATDVVYAWDPVVGPECNLCYDGAQPAGSFRLEFK
ncbi:MAG: GDSL-type esterase/lipase family protein [Bacteroidales bacterium]|uniref:GDSL-type esterase/lipase family protein n=1 Tax=Porphyromonas sp. TaxID=1924944 RepID=UPI002973221A|nr:GDSL-type esterase/lipase family protein [Porphyromonas sp.]MDD7438380.1 GDSL-type esterase/lipase family protein [Bacteroidales bacterium]MDY3068006.1 GDSL-type esterase/lipase family protein [Porphyromonas sp.]